MIYDIYSVFYELDIAMLGGYDITLCYNIKCDDKILDVNDRRINIRAKDLYTALKMMDPESEVDYSKCGLESLNELFKCGYSIRMYGERFFVQEDGESAEMRTHLDLIDASGEVERESMSWDGTKTLFSCANDYAMAKAIIDSFNP